MLKCAFCNEKTERAAAFRVFRLEDVELVKISFAVRIGEDAPLHALTPPLIRPIRNKIRIWEDLIRLIMVFPRVWSATVPS